MPFSKLITLFRIIVLPLIIYFIYQENLVSSFWAIILLSLTLISYFLDSYLPHKKIRSFLDPFSDKIVIMSLLLVFVLRNSFNGFFLGFLLLREIIILIIRWMSSQDDVPIKGENERKLIIYTEFGLVLGLLVQEFITYDRSLPAVWTQITTSVISIFTILALFLAIISIIHYGIFYGKGIRARKMEGKKAKKESTVILANKRSRGYRDRYRRRLLRIFDKRRQASIFYLSHQGQIFTGSNKQIGKANHVIIAGGDGTFESALNYKPFWKKSLGFFPLGAGNAFYSYFYKGKRFEYLRSRFQFHEIDLDILELEWDKGKIQTSFLAIGIDAEVVRQSRHRTRHGLFDYLGASWRALIRSKADFDLTCTIDGNKHHWDNCINLTIGKVPYYGFGIRSLLGQVKPDDGQISGLACINTHSIFLNKTLRVWSLVLAALNLPKPPLFPLRGKEFIIKSEVPLPLQAGGEFLGYTNFVKVIVKRKQKVLVI